MSRAKKIDFHKDRVVCFTLDIDWAPEAMIEKTLQIFDSAHVPVTVFLTHDSATVRNRYDNNKSRRHVGLHPNFLRNSNYTDVISTCAKLWPKAKSFRSHAYFDNTLVTKEFADRGFLYDSNLGLFLQPRCEPLMHHSGLIRFPVYWEDDVHLDRFSNPPRLAQITKELDDPGLKIFNFHPFHIALNTPSLDYYQKHRILYKSKTSYQKHVHLSDGTEKLLLNLLNYVAEKNLDPQYLDDIYLDLMSAGNKRK